MNASSLGLLASAPHLSTILQGLEILGVRPRFCVDPVVAPAPTAEEAAGAKVVLVALSEGMEEALESEGFENLLYSGGLDTLFDEAEGREGWSAERWAEHLRAKVIRWGVLAPSGPAEAESTPDPAPTPPPATPPHASPDPIGELPAFDPGPIGGRSEEPGGISLQAEAFPELESGGDGISSHATQAPAEPEPAIALPDASGFSFNLEGLQEGAGDAPEGANLSAGQDNTEGQGTETADVGGFSFDLGDLSLEAPDAPEGDKAPNRDGIAREDEEASGRETDGPGAQGMPTTLDFAEPDGAGDALPAPAAGDAQPETTGENTPLDLSTDLETNLGTDFSMLEDGGSEGAWQPGGEPAQAHAEASDAPMDLGLTLDDDPSMGGAILPALDEDLAFDAQADTPVGSGQAEPNVAGGPGSAHEPEDEIFHLEDGPPAARSTRAAPEGEGQDNGELILIVGGLGGPDGIREILRHLDTRIPVPVVIHQPMPQGRYEVLAANLAKHATIPVAKAAKGQRLAPGQAWVLEDGLVPHQEPGGSLVAEDGAVEDALRLVGQTQSIAVLVSGADPHLLMPGMEAMAMGGLLFGQDPDAAYDSQAIEALVDLGLVTADGPTLGSHLAERWGLVSPAPAGPDFSG